MESITIIIAPLFLLFCHYSNALHCLVVRPGHGLISEKCPRLAVACRVRIERNSIVWYEYSKLYDRNHLACVLQNEYGSEDRSGCVRKPSGAVRCWCYGQSNCNNPENIKKLYQAFIGGSKKELDAVIDQIETSDVSDYNFADPLLNIYEPMEESHANTVIGDVRYRVPSERGHSHSESSYPSRAPITRHSAPPHFSHSGDHQILNFLNFSRPSTENNQISNLSVYRLPPTSSSVPSEPIDEKFHHTSRSKSFVEIYNNPHESKQSTTSDRFSATVVISPRGDVRQLPTDQIPNEYPFGEEHPSSSDRSHEARELPRDSANYFTTKSRKEGKRSRVNSAIASHPTAPFVVPIAALSLLLSSYVCRTCGVI